MSKDKKQFLNAIFIKKVWEDKVDAGNNLLSVGIRVEDFITELKKYPRTEKGYVNFTISRQKNDTAKYSMYVDDWKKDGATYNKQTNNDKIGSNNDSELPF